MISDFVKGKDRFGFSGNIQKGIVLHRSIDEFTDLHAATKKAKEIFRPHYRLYSGAIIDILYDHFLAKNWLNYSEIPLEIYAKNVYSFFQENIGIFPPEMQRLLPYMIEYNWLVSYASISGIEKTLVGMNKRTKGISKMDLATEDLIIHYDEFESDFAAFFIELMQFAEEKTKELLLK